MNNIKILQLITKHTVIQEMCPTMHLFVNSHIYDDMLVNVKNQKERPLNYPQNPSIMRT